MQYQTALEIANACDIHWDTFLNIVKYPEKHYRVFRIKKKSGGYRSICSPKPELALVQNFIYKNILNSVPIHDSAFAFVKKRSIKDNALKHSKSDKMLCLDIKDFFPSISRNRIYYVFMKLCNINKDLADTLVRLCTLNDGLPQGAITSPILSNIVSYRLDKSIDNFANSNGLIYTRYADDITISGSKESINKVLKSQVKGIIELHGFKINAKKSRINTINKGAIITGLRVFNDRIQVPRNYIRKIEQDIYYLNKYGLNSYKEHEKILNNNYLGHLVGKIKFVEYIEPLKGKKLYDEFLKIDINDDLDIIDDFDIFDIIETFEE
jgi:hypothetical protein